MKFKIDENLPIDVAVLLGQAGYDAATVIGQSLGGSLTKTLPLSVNVSNALW